MIKELIQQGLIFKRLNSRGWHEIKCECCHDYQYRGAFKFDPTEITYYCWNCDIRGKYIEGETSMTHTMRGILNSFGFSNDDINRSLGQSFFDQGGFTKNTSNAKGKVLKCSTKEVELPEFSYKLSDAKDDDIWKIIATKYIESRGLNSSDFSWYLSKDPLYRNRLIIPFYRNNKLIYWQARAFKDVKNKYLNTPNTTKDNIIFGYDELETYSDLPIFVFEGVMDAISVGGISLIGSVLTDCKINALNRSPREKVFVIDKDKNGKKMGLKALENGWSISSIDGEVRDANHAVQEYGKLWTLGNIMKNIKEGLSAKVFLEVMCKDNDEWK